MKECQGIRVRVYQHQDEYVSGDKVWFQYKDGLAWHGPGEVIYQKGNAVFIHSNGDVKKVAACKVKPYELKERNEENKEEKTYFAKEEEKKLDIFMASKKVHEVANHKSAEQLIISYRNAGLIRPETVKTMRQVVKDCKICQKFGRSMVKPKVAVPRVTSFNEIVTLDLKQFGNKYVL